MATFWGAPAGGDATLWRLKEGSTDLYFTCVGVDGDDDKVYVWQASTETFVELQKVGDLTKTSVSTTYTVTVEDDVVFADTSGGAFTITLPALADAQNKQIYIKKEVGSALTLTIDGDGSETIDGDPDIKIAGAGGSSVTLFPRTSTDWGIL